MCRLAAYFGTEITLSQFLQEPEHSLIKQSWAPKEMLDGTVNADGYGVAWLSGTDIPSSYKNVLPIWSDTNLDSLGRSLSSRVWLANVRGATPGQGISEANTQPFIKDELIFTHNGCLKPFGQEIKSSLLDILSNEIRAEINGNSDSLYLFALLQHHLLIQKSLPEAIINMMNDLRIICSDKVSALLNLVIFDGDIIHACRYAINGSCPSLYYSLGDDNIRVASEPLTPNDEWVSFPEHSLVSFNNTGVIERYKL
ncbi:MAG TPA: ergothioneine biosynthesis protein EgtC [Thiotrichaceae bacterium]|jgi:glutamine amidotransferase|nr:ergothioneine biosynthesis protein EgtC [Thiotrichaceae bacterium]HIM07770.1 ergothioneine biosynthesis protein EgtC [Gammaproteobacteria bacterium]